MESLEIVWYRRGRVASAVTVSEQGLSFNRAAAESLGMPEYVRLGFAPEEKCIVVQPADGPEEVFRFASRLRAGSVKINSRAFVRELRAHIKGNFGAAQRYLARWGAKEGMLLVDLGQPVGEAGRGRSRAGGAA